MYFCLLMSRELELTSIFLLKEDFVGVICEETALNNIPWLFTTLFSITETSFPRIPRVTGRWLEGWSRWEHMLPFPSALPMSSVEGTASPLLCLTELLESCLVVNLHQVSVILSPLLVPPFFSGNGFLFC